MTPMYLPGTAAVIDDVAAAEAELVPVTAISRPVPVQVVAGAPSLPSLTGTTASRALACEGDPDLFFAESPDDVELAKSLCSDCPVRLRCLAGAIERREPWGVWGGELFIRGEIVPRKRGRGRPRKSEVAA
jgi:WhiB family transcriptional regulator, redox-sensing transcriptional regulator